MKEVNKDQGYHRRKFIHAISVDASNDTGKPARMVMSS
jgi:hypothetical protein